MTRRPDNSPPRHTHSAGQSPEQQVSVVPTKLRKCFYGSRLSDLPRLKRLRTMVSESANLHLLLLWPPQILSWISERDANKIVERTNEIFPDGAIQSTRYKAAHQKALWFVWSQGFHSPSFSTHKFSSAIILHSQFSTTCDQK